MPAPTIEFHVYDAETAGYTLVSAGSTMTLDSVSAGNWTRGKAFRVHIKGNVGVPTFDLSTVKLWFNDTNARFNDQQNVDLGDRYSATGNHHWSANMVQAAATATTGLMAVTALQTSVATCPAAALTLGSWMSAGNSDTANGILVDANVAATFKGDTLADGVLLDMSSPATISVAYSRHIGLSFKPTPSASDGVYTNFGIEAGYDFS